MRRRVLRKVIVVGLASALLAGCSTEQKNLARNSPRFEPEHFFAGHTRSSGVFDYRTGKSRKFTTDAIGQLDGNILLLSQTFSYEDGETQKRFWRIRRIDEHHYEGTANDVVGIAKGEAEGNAFHFEYTVALKPGRPLYNVQLDQSMYLRKNGTVRNTGTVRKLGIKVATVTERFRRVR